MELTTQRRSARAVSWFASETVIAWGENERVCKQGPLQFVDSLAIKVPEQFYFKLSLDLRRKYTEKYNRIGVRTVRDMMANFTPFTPNHARHFIRSRYFLRLLEANWLLKQFLRSCARDN